MTSTAKKEKKGKILTLVIISFGDLSTFHTLGH